MNQSYEIRHFWNPSMRELILWKAIHSSQISPFLPMTPNISNTEGTSSHASQQQDTLHVAAMSLYEPLKCPHFPHNHSNNYCWTFQILPVILPARKKEETEYRYHYQMQHVSKTAKIFKYISECIFHRTQLMAMHNTVMTSNTNGVPPRETHMQISFMQCKTTNCQPFHTLW